VSSHLRTTPHLPVSSHACPRAAARARLFLAALSLLLMVTAACQGVAGSSTSTGTGTALTVNASDQMRFDPQTLNVPAGQPISVTLVNGGALIHDIVVNDGAEQPVKIEAAGKQSAQGTFTMLRPGTYAYICAQPGHEAAGMTGTIVAR
jgi:plastocyanin